METPKTSEESEWTGVMLNYRMHPPLELSDGKRAQLSDNLLTNEALFETSINGRETLYEEVKTPETPEVSEWTGVMHNYRRDPPLELTEEQ